MLDTRRNLASLLNPKNHLSKIEKRINKTAIKFMLSLLIAIIAGLLPDYAGLDIKAQRCLFIMIFAAGLWITEAIPAFATSLIIISLNIVLLGFDDFNFAHGKKEEWIYYLSPWSSSLIFLFFAGFIMAAATSKVNLDMWIAKRVLAVVGSNPRNVLVGLMGITFVLSMFLSNTATAAMMLAIIAPMGASLKENDPFKKGVLLGVAVAANIGGMGTIIGTPPNAIAVGILGDRAPTFLGWMIYAVPPAVVMVLLAGIFIYRTYPPQTTALDLSHVDDVDHKDDTSKDSKEAPIVPSWKKLVVIITIFTTVGLWLTSPLHHVPTMVVSILPVAMFSFFHIIDVEDIRNLGWDVILLIAGGLSLGLAVSKTGLDDWLAASINLSGLGLLGIAFAFSYIMVVVGNFMSNTAVANILLPIVAAFTANMGTYSSNFAIGAVTLCASFTMLFPVSTPPNAIVYSFAILKISDFIKVGLFSILLAPVVIIGWMSILH